MADAMVRKQVYIDPRQEDELKKAAARTGLRESELIRRGIDLVLSGADPGERRLVAFERAESLAERIRGRDLACGTGDQNRNRDELHER